MENTLVGNRERSWRRERQRFAVLERIYHRTGTNCTTVVQAREIGDELGLSLEETFRTIHYLENHGYLRYVAGGPSVCSTGKGLDYLERVARRRRSIREE